MSLPSRLERLTGRIVSGRYLQHKLAASNTVYRNSLSARAGKSLRIVTILNGNSIGLVGVSGAWSLSGHVPRSPPLVKSSLAALLFRTISLHARHLASPFIPLVSTSKQSCWHLVSQQWHCDVGVVVAQDAWHEPHISSVVVLWASICVGEPSCCA